MFLINLIDNFWQLCLFKKTYFEKKKLFKKFLIWVSGNMW